MAQRILNAARAVIIERGLDGLSVQAVATAAGLQKSAIAHHFGNKEGLLKALIEVQAGSDTLEMRAMVRALPPEQRLRAFLDVLQRFVEQSDQWRLVLALFPLRYRSEMYRRQHAAQLERAIDLDVEVFRMRPDDAGRVLFSIVYAALEGFTMQYGFRGDDLHLNAGFARLEASLRPAFLEAMEDVETS